MSHTLTEVDTFTATVVVPDGTDPGSGRSEDVEAIAQGLANRTLNLKNRADGVDATLTDAARKSQQNTFTKGQIVNTESNWADDPLISTTAKPGDDPTDLSSIVPPVAAGSNRWKLILRQPTQDDAWASIWVGQFPDGAAMVNNARWHIPTQRWRQIDTDFPSTAIVGRSGQYLVSHMPAGAAPWADWPTDGGADFIASGNCSASLLFLYTPAKTLTKAVSVLDYVGSAGSDGDGVGGPTLLAGENATFTVRAPHGALLGAVRLKVEVLGSDVNLTVKTKRRHGVDFGATTPSSYATVKALTAVTFAVASPGPIYNITSDDAFTALGFGDLTVSKDETYQIYVRNNSGGGLSVLAIDFSMVDYGPRNH